MMLLFSNIRAAITCPRGRRFAFNTLCFCLIFSANYSVQGAVEIAYLEPNNAGEQAVGERLLTHTTLKQVVASLNNSFVDTAALTIALGAGKTPELVVSEATVVWPYAFAQELLETNAGEQANAKSSPHDYISFAVVSEWALWLLQEYGLPRHSPNLTAAHTALTEHLLLRVVPNGGRYLAEVINDRYALNNMPVDMHLRYRLNRVTLKNSACALYGDAPEQYEALVATVELSKAESIMCISDQFEASAHWNAWLSPMLVKPLELPFDPV